MTMQERMEIERRIDVMVGSREQQRKITEAMSLEDRINSNNRYNKVRAQLFKIAEKEGLKALASVVITGGKWCEGCTASGKKYVWDGNNGMTERSRYCGSLWIEGVGTVFTSGTITKAVEYLINN
jgi:hypothetical protein